MLEYNFTKLDDDFITLWSRFILTDDITEEKVALKELAEKGQINAVQSWYLFKSKGANPTIDEIVKGYDGLSYNELWARANYIASDNTLFGEYKKLHDEMWEAYESWKRDRYGEGYKRFGYKRREIYNHPIHVSFKDAIDRAATQYTTINDYLVYERMNEMLQYYKDIAAPIVNWEEESELEKTIKKNNVKIIKELSKQYKELKSKGKNATDNPQLAFALGKALVLFPNKKKYREFGLSLLKELAERNYVYINPQTSFSI